jgi:tetratricopeptide (TPR) repeat protein
MNRIDEAESCYKQVLDVNPQAAFLNASIENKRGNFDKAIQLYNLALSHDKSPL